MQQTEQQKWKEYRDRELAAVTPILARLGYTLDSDQPHIVGERYLMMSARDVGGGGYKLVLNGKDTKTNARVIIKATSDKAAQQEIEKERRARQTITSIRFSYHSFKAPAELLHTHEGPYLISVTEYIEQDKNFLDRSIEEEFALALRAFKIQEGVHATTSAHADEIRSVFGMTNAEMYLTSFRNFNVGVPEAEDFLASHVHTIEQYCGFLTHSDFVPHNLRIHNGDIYLLDYASIHFGNKYESWGRFTNFMMLHNPPLERALVEYVQINRSPEESLSLKCMRVYKLGFLLSYYHANTAKTTGDALTLNQARIQFWTHALTAVLTDTVLASEAVTEYKKVRDSLRTEEEKSRQQELN